MLRFGQKWWLTGLLALLLAGCQQTATPNPGQITAPPETPQQRQLASSLETWNALKAENGTYYRYEVSAGSVFGPSYDTTLTVQEGEVVQRDLAIIEIDDEGNVTVIESWSETGAALGSHDEGAELITIDARYSSCRDEVLSQNPTTNEILLDFMENGVLAYCAAFPKDIYYGGGFDGGGEYLDALEFLSSKTD